MDEWIRAATFVLAGVFLVILLSVIIIAIRWDAATCTQTGETRTVHQNIMLIPVGKVLIPFPARDVIEYEYVCKNGKTIWR